MTSSTDQTMTASALPAHGPVRTTEKQRYLYGPIIDFLCLGGISLLLLPIIFVLPEKELSPIFGLIFLGIAHFINHPHFAFSYQVFYEGFLNKAFGRENDPGLRARYILAGIIVPIFLAAFLAYTMVVGDARLLGYSANLMTFLVGWHYVKQGYGMLMVDAALKRRFFDDEEKKILLVNAYAVWGLSWLSVNSILSERTLWGIQYYMFHIPELVLALGTCVAVGTTIMMGSALFKKWRANGGSLPVNGVVAYLVSLYLWLLLVRWNMLWLLMVPALHSIQYLVVVTRYRMNQTKGASDADEPARPALLRGIFRRRDHQRYANFVIIGMILGYVGFWGAPEFLQAIISYDQVTFGPTAFLFVFWIFINVHHYFLDNVMWRSQNPDVRKYLFT